MGDFYAAWARLWQVRTPAETAANLWCDWWLTLHQAAFRPFELRR